MHMHVHDISIVMRPLAKIKDETLIIYNDILCINWVRFTMINIDSIYISEPDI